LALRRRRGRAGPRVRLAHRVGRRPTVVGGPPVHGAFDPAGRGPDPRHLRLGGLPSHPRPRLRADLGQPRSSSTSRWPSRASGRR
jgi:hypothetical protein